MMVSQIDSEHMSNLVETHMLRVIMLEFQMHDAYRQTNKLVTELKTKLNITKKKFIKVEVSLRYIVDENGEATHSLNEPNDS